MKYQSKRNPEIYAALDFEDKERKVSYLIYLTGDDKGKSFNITNSTLKRWWKKCENVTEEEVQQEIINTPYRPDVTPHYIPKPQSVIEYEAAKNKKYNANLISFEDMCDVLGEYCKKINDTSKYIMLKDGLTTLWRKSQRIDMYSTESFLEPMSELGFTSKPNKDKKRPLHFEINTQEQFDSFAEYIKTFDFEN